jgi:hypothetical protein
MAGERTHLHQITFGDDAAPQPRSDAACQPCGWSGPGLRELNLIQQNGQYRHIEGEAHGELQGDADGSRRNRYLCQHVPLRDCNGYLGGFTRPRSSRGHSRAGSPPSGNTRMGDLVECSEFIQFSGAHPTDASAHPLRPSRDGPRLSSRPSDAGRGARPPLSKGRGQNRCQSSALGRLAAERLVRDPTDWTYSSLGSKLVVAEDPEPRKFF